MKIGKFKVSNRAVSPVIATLLMIAIAVAASIIVYVWSIGLLGGLMGGGGSQLKEQLIMEAYKWGTSGELNFTLRNVGSANVQIAAVYLAGSAYVPTYSPGAATINVGSTSTVHVGATLGFTPGVSYPLKVVTSTGGVFTFSVINGSSG